MERLTTTQEADRLRALHELDVLDSPPEESIDRITRLASKILDTPIVLVSLIDEHRQWFKSRVGLTATETPREQAFCAHAILGDEVMIVEDATKDRRFIDNPLVTGDPDIRFYAGAPLIYGDGIRLGTLCAIDRTPRVPSPEDLETLRDLAAVVVDELRLRRSLRLETEASARSREHTVQLAAANEALEQFTRLASHDLRAPIKQMINTVDLALTEDDPARVAADLMTIRRSATALEQIVVGYRRLSQLERGLSKANPRSVSTLVEEATAAAAHPDVTQIGEADVMCDPELAVQLFTNVVANAATHAPLQPLTIEVEEMEHRVRCRASNPSTLSAPVDDSLFLPFRRLDTSCDGDGLGLAIVDRVVKLHGGTPSVRCSDGVFQLEFDLPSVRPGTVEADAS